ncbi:mannosyltransferase [Coemansia sp. RSA 1933]|nr:mannosyltransferase [Coemansia sp. RSA 1933]
MTGQGTPTSIKQARAEKRTAKRIRKAREEAQQTAIKQKEIKQLEQQGTAKHQVYVPSLGLLFRVLSLVRVAGALRAPIQDCDEVYNYWEPLHLLHFGTGKQTWEYAPQHALRSYAFLYGYKWIVSALHLVLGFRSKVQVFYALRIALGLASAGCEALFVRRIADCVDRKIANMTALALFGMAGLFHAGSALLPTSFAMYLCALGSAAAMRAPTDASRREHLVQRVAPGVAAFVVAAAGGWPYAIVVAVPFALEEVIVRGGSVAGDRSSWWAWRMRRMCWFAAIGTGTLAIVVGAMAAVDSWHYGRLAVAAWNQVSYNVFGGSEGGSQLYGTEPWYYYLKNGLVNGNAVMVLALASLPAWLVYYAVLRVATARSAQQQHQQQQGDTADRLIAAHWLLLFRILPFFLTLIVFSLQPHKEERFLTIVYPHMCFNAAAALSLVQPLCAWAVVRLSHSGVREKLIHSAVWVDRLSTGVLAMAALLGASRMAALSTYYSAPTRAFMHLHGSNSSGDAFLPLGPTVKSFWQQNSNSDVDQIPANETIVCMGKDWYRFPSSYWLPANHRLAYLQTPYFDGHLPGDFVPTKESGSLRASTSAQRDDFNGLNRWEPTHALPESTAPDLLCNYIIDIEYPERGSSDSQAIVVAGDRWRVVGCEPILDPDNTPFLGRVLYVPKHVLLLLGAAQNPHQSWGNMCVYKSHQGLDPFLSLL